MKTILILKILHDSDCESPADCDLTWRVRTFDRHKFKTCVSPSDYVDHMDGHEPILKKKYRDLMDRGLCFWLSCYQHGSVKWELGPVSHCRWDSASHAGLLIWENDWKELGPRTKEDRRKDAKAFIQNYTDWCNGACYGYDLRTCEIPDETDPEDLTSKGLSALHKQGKDIDSCFGFVGTDSLEDQIQYLANEHQQKLYLCSAFECGGIEDYITCNTPTKENAKV